MQWHTQLGSITTNLKVKIDFTLPELSTTKIVTWNCHVDESAKRKKDMLLGRYILTEYGLNLKLVLHITKAYNGNLLGSSEPMVD